MFFCFSQEKKETFFDLTHQMFPQNFFDSLSFWYYRKHRRLILVKKEAKNQVQTKCIKNADNDMRHKVIVMQKEALKIHSKGQQEQYSQNLRIILCSLDKCAQSNTSQTKVKKYQCTAVLN